MVRVYLSLGSNIEREKHIKAGLVALAGQFGELVVSPIYESESIGFDGDHFLNLVVGMNTELSVGELQSRIKCIEDDNGRVRGGPKFSPRTLDIDILTYGDAQGVIDDVQLPRDEIVKNAFVLLPLSEVAGSELHPELNMTYQQLWLDFDKASQKLWRYDFS